eukprot:TRINITY_DN74377_c0_g1_i1.p1 TRINITY_DN74377_c0_g1~~TRINITY_DN74377_c0_g1_i1.p1  ORF type:complete len:587 (-),score=112.09 TRINITY_DN74377_c0_g1_i1:71-1831(-)
MAFGRRRRIAGSRWHPAAVAARDRGGRGRSFVALLLLSSFLDAAVARDSGRGNADEAVLSASVAEASGRKLRREITAAAAASTEDDPSELLEVAGAEQQRSAASESAQHHGALLRSEAHAREAEVQAHDASASGGAGALAEGSVASASASDVSLGFSLTVDGLWHAYPNLEKKVTLLEDAVVLIRYQIATIAGGGSLFSRIVIDNAPVDASHSGEGDVQFASNYGMYAQHMALGAHDIRLEYKVLAAAGTSPGYAVTADPNAFGANFHLNLMVLPEAVVFEAHPKWLYKFKHDVFEQTQGLQKDVTVTAPTPILCFYQIVGPGGNNKAQARLFRNGLEQQESRSVTGDLARAQLSGLYTALVPEGRHYFTVKSKHVGNDNIFRPESDWMVRFMEILQLPESHVYNYQDESHYNVAHGAAKNWKGLHDHEIDLDKEHYVIATYSISWKCAGGNLLNYMTIDGVEKKETRTRTGNVKYCSGEGMWMGLLGPGAHRFSTKYTASKNMPMTAAEMADFGSRSMNVIVLPRISGVVDPNGGSLLQQASSTSLNGSTLLSSGAMLTSDLERQVREGRAPLELVGRVANLGRR